MLERVFEKSVLGKFVSCLKKYTKEIESQIALEEPVYKSKNKKL